MLIYKYKNNIYKIKRCKNKDIPSHIEKVYMYWSKYSFVNIKEKKISLKKSIKENLAFKLLNNKKKPIIISYFNRIEGYENILFCSLFWSCSKTLLPILGLYLRKYINIDSIIYLPYSKKLLPYTFLSTEQSIRNYYIYNKPLICNLLSDEIKNRMYYPFKYNIIKEL